jgi:hypothetical protein
MARKTRQAYTEEFRREYPTFAEAWQACTRADWMLWIARKAGVDFRTLTLAKGLCAETVKHLMTDERSRKAVEVAIAYGRGEATDEELQDAAADAAYAAYAAAHAADAKKENQLKTANICREILTDAVMQLLTPNDTRQ